MLETVVVVAVNLSFNNFAMVCYSDKYVQLDSRFKLYSGKKLAVEASSLDLKDQESGESDIKDFSPLSCSAFYWALSTLLLNLASLQCQPPEGKKILKSLR